MGGRLVRFLAWKGLLYLFVAVVLAGVTRDLTLTALLTVGFALGDGSVAVLLRTPTAPSDRPSSEDDREPQVPRADHRSTP